MARVTAQQFITEVDAVLELLQEELAGRKAGVPGEGSVSELQAIIKEFKGLRREARWPLLRQNTRRRLVSSYLVDDTWDLQAELAKRVMHITQLYCHLR